MWPAWHNLPLAPGCTRIYDHGPFVGGPPSCLTDFTATAFDFGSRTFRWWPTKLSGRLYCNCFWSYHKVLFTVLEAPVEALCFAWPELPLDVESKLCWYLHSDCPFQRSLCSWAIDDTWLVLNVARPAPCTQTITNCNFYKYYHIV